MNILREFRRATKRSIATRIRLVLLFSVILIVNTYAWFNAEKDIKISGLEGDTTPWDVAYYVDDKEILDEEAKFTIDELYPGMPEREEVANIYNIAKTGTIIKYELKSVKIFGEEVLDELKANGSIVTEGNTTHIFSDDSKYPFDISYTFDKDRLSGKYVDDDTTPDAHATFKYNLSWNFESGSTDAEKLEKDTIDTVFGKNAYKYYQNSENDSNKAIEIYVKITSSINREDKGQ